MKKLSSLILLFLMLYPVLLRAEDFLGAPVIPDRVIIKKTEKRFEMKSKLIHDEALKFYKQALKDFKDIKFREWKDATYIEDDGKLAWHSITISKGDEKETTIVIMKDNWTWIIGTLTLRYIGVFAVLMVLFLGMSISGNIISRWVRKTEARKQQEKV
jgi:hypothetical protein